jgi:hypothetical protein
VTTRRAWLAAAGGLPFAWGYVLQALAQGRVEQGVRRLRGGARLNEVAAKERAGVRPGDSIATAADGEIVFVIGRDAFLVRGDSRVEVAGGRDSPVASGLRVVTGAVLSVFAPGGRRQIRTATAVIGIRGTGIYVEAGPDKTYACTCYGEAVLAPAADPKAREVVRTKHHEQPRYIMAKGAPQMMMKAPVVNHTDAELMLLESLVGRVPPFVGKGYSSY